MNKSFGNSTVNVNLWLVNSVFRWQCRYLAHLGYNWNYTKPSRGYWSILHTRVSKMVECATDQYNHLQVKVGKEKELEASLRRLRGQNVDISQEAAEIRDYLELAQQLPKSSFIDMFQWKYAHSLTIGVGIVLLAIFGGTVAISYYASSIFESAGCSATLGTTVLAIIQIPFSILGVVLMDKSGRRPLWMVRM
ncbi:hypothetical protein CsSME_00010900 [Camellia sinensis var. sinensis]